MAFMNNDTGSELLDGFLDRYEEQGTAVAAKEQDIAAIDGVLFVLVVVMIALVFLLPYH